MYPFLIGWISYALCDWIFTYATDHAILLKLYTTKNSAFAVQKVMSDSFIYCNLCSRVLEKGHERVLLVKGWKQFDVGRSKE